MKAHDQATKDQDRYLLFLLGDDVYGTPLMGVREVVEFQKAKPIPHTVQSFLGVINIRGEIIGVVDLRSRFRYPADERPGLAMMVFGTDKGTLAAVVDRMDAVVRIASDSIDPAPRVESRLPLTYLLGIARNRDRLVTLIDLPKVLEQEELASLVLAGAAKRSIG